MIFNQKLKTINSPRDLLKAVKLLRSQNIPYPLTTKYEVDLREIGLHPKETWYKYQGEHWQGWIGGYVGVRGFLFSRFFGGSYKRKNRQRSAKFIYNHIMCPPMLIWLAEVTGFESERLKASIDTTFQTEQYQKQCAIIRKEFSWAEVEQAILQTIYT
jgi:hypothetical protein